MTRSIILTLLFFLYIMASHATYPSYYSHFYKGLVVLTGQTDTIRGYVLLEPSQYKDTILLPFDKYYNYAGSILLYERDTLKLNTRPRIINKEQISFIRLYYNVVFSDSTDKTLAWSLNYFFGVRSMNKRQQIINSGLVKEYHTDFRAYNFKNKNLLLRMLDSGKIAVYDDFLNPEKYVTAGYQLFYFLSPNYSSLLSRNKIYLIFKTKIEEMPSHFSLNFRKERFILRFLNKRYHTKFKKINFYGNRDMLEYISEHG